MKMQGGDLFDRIVSMENLYEAHRKASKGKSHYREVQFVNENPEAALLAIQNMLVTGAFTTSPYVVEEAMKGGKLRTIHKLPYYPDRIVQHAIVNVCSPIWIKSMIRDTFQSIPGRGSTDCYRRVRKAVQGAKPRYGTKLDIEKFYPSVKNKYVLNPRTLRIKCKRTFALLEDIVRSLAGLPLGNHTSQFAGNLVISSVDWYAKQVLKIKYYYRYCDDIVILSDCEEELNYFRQKITEKLAELELIVKPDDKIVDLAEEPLDFVGYRITHGKVKLRKKMATRFKKACRKGKVKVLPSYYGWCKHANAKNLYYKHAAKAKRKWQNYQNFKLSA